MDLQDVVDDLAAAVGRPVEAEDRRWRLLAYSAHPADADEVRRSSILERGAPPPVAAWLDSLGLERAEGVVDVPANDELGMVERVAAPLRHRGSLFGFLWVLGGPRAFTADERSAIAAAADEAGVLLWRRRAWEREERRLEAEALRAVLAGGDDTALRAQHDWPADVRVAVLVATAASGTELVEVAERARRAWDAGRLLWLADGGRLVVVARLGSGARASVDAALQALVRAGAAAAGASAERAGLADAPAALREAAGAAELARDVPELGPAARWDELGGWAAIKALLGDRPAVAPPDIAALDPQLRTALEAVLDHAGDVAEAAAALGMHRATLYRRLERVEQLLGADLRSGDDRLRLHLGLRLHRLAAAGDRERP